MVKGKLLAPASIWQQDKQWVRPSQRPLWRLGDLLQRVEFEREELNYPKWWTKAYSWKGKRRETTLETKQMFSIKPFGTSSVFMVDESSQSFHCKLPSGTQELGLFEARQDFIAQHTIKKFLEMIHALAFFIQIPFRWLPITFRKSHLRFIYLFWVVLGRWGIGPHLLVLEGQVVLEIEPDWPRARQVS